MQLPYGAGKEDFEKCKKIIASLTNTHNNLDEVTLKIINAAYSTGGGYSEEILFAYAKAYFGMESYESETKG